MSISQCSSGTVFPVVLENGVGSGLNRLSKLFDWEKLGSHGHIRATNKHGEHKIIDDPFLAELLAPDIALYEHAKQVALLSTFD